MIPTPRAPRGSARPARVSLPAANSPASPSGSFACLIRQARARCRPLGVPPGQRQLRPQQVAAGYAVHGGNTAANTGVQAAVQVAAPVGDAVWAGAGAAAALAVCTSSPIESVKTLQEVRAGRRKARSARQRVDAARALLQAAGPGVDPVQRARDRLDHRHALEAWVATRRCFQGTLRQLRQRRSRWQQELDDLRRRSNLSRAERLRRQRLERRLEAASELGLRRVAALRSSAVSMEKRVKEGVSVGRNLGGLLGVASGLAAGSSPFLALVSAAFLPLLLPVLLLVDGVAGSVEARQLLTRARAGLRQLHRVMQRTASACRTLQSAPAGSPRALFCQGLAALTTAQRHQERQWQRELRQGWWRRMRSAAFLVLAPVALGLGVAALLGLAATPAGWAVAALLGAVVVGYCVAQAVFNHQQARQARAVVGQQQDHVGLARRLPAWQARALRLNDPLWSGNGYLAIDMMARALILAAQDPSPTERARLQHVLRHDLGAGQRWTSQLLTLAAAVPADAAPDHADVWRLCESLMRRFGLPVPKARHRPGAA